MDNFLISLRYIQNGNLLDCSGEASNVEKFERVRLWWHWCVSCASSKRFTEVSAFTLAPTLPQVSRRCHFKGARTSQRRISNKAINCIYRAQSVYTRLMLFTFARTKHIRAEYSHRAFSICIHQSLLTENRSARKRRGKQRKLHLIKSISFFFTFGRAVSRDRTDKIDNRPNLIGDALDSAKSFHIKIF